MLAIRGSASEHRPVLGGRTLAAHRAAFALLPLLAATMGVPVSARASPSGELIPDASYIGASAWDSAGAAAGLGDVDGDGLHDFLIGSDGHGAAGRAYLILGRESGWDMGASLAQADASFDGEEAGARVGLDHDPAGDVNGDGLDDLLIRTTGTGGGESLSTPQLYLVFGKTSGWASGTDLGSSDASILMGDVAYWSSTGVGDVDADGFDDILVGTSVGQAHLFHGKDAGWAIDTDLGEADATFIAGMAEYVYVGGAGDVDGDGIEDLLFGCPDEGYAESGLTYLVLGDAAGWGINTSLSMVAAATFEGTGVWDGAGGPVEGVGDVDGDGFDDFLISAFTASGSSPLSGKVYLFLGRPSGWATGTSVANADASFEGENAGASGVGNQAGWDIGGAGDVDGDGYDDFLVSAIYNDEAAPGAGKIYLILGKTTGWSTGVSLASADAWFLGDASSDLLGTTVAGLGDVNGDGFGDFLASSSGNDEGGEFAGQSYVFFGTCSELDGDADGHSPCDGDCDDRDAVVSPDAEEACNGIDDNCDGVIDEWCGPSDDDDSAAQDYDEDADPAFVCRCTSAARSGNPATMLLPLLALVLDRRRRSRVGR